MSNWIHPFFYTLLALVILGLAGYLFLLKRNQQAEASRWKRIADQKYKEGRSEASQILRAAVDQISEDKARLNTLSDRELICEAVLGLAGLGRRMDRMEDSIRSVSQFESLLTDINSQAGILSQNAELLNQQMQDAQNAASAFQSAVSGTSEAVYSLSDSTHSIEALLEDVSGQIRSVQELSSRFSSLQTQMDTVLRRMNQTLKANPDNPAAAISQMDDRILTLSGQLQNLSEGLNLMAESLEGVQETMAGIHGRTLSIQKALDAEKDPV